MTLLLLILSLGFWVESGSPAFGMCVSTSYQPVAWSQDGQSVLIYEIASGPEGGGSVTYVLIDFRKKKSDSFALSSNFSPGDGSEPETISEDDCRAATARANQLLTKQAFEARFEADPKSCRKGRDGLLKQKERKDYSLDFEKATLIASKIGLPGHGASALAYTKNGKNLVVIENNSSCDARCYRARPNAQPESYKNDGSCE